MIISYDYFCKYSYDYFCKYYVRYPKDIYKKDTKEKKKDTKVLLF